MDSSSIALTIISVLGTLSSIVFAFLSGIALFLTGVFLNFGIFGAVGQYSDVIRGASSLQEEHQQGEQECQQQPQQPFPPIVFFLWFCLFRQNQLLFVLGCNGFVFFNMIAETSTATIPIRYISGAMMPPAS